MAYLADTNVAARRHFHRFPEITVVEPKDV
jgi:hypothetical protein